MSLDPDENDEQPDYIKLVSKEGHEFFAKRDVAEVSGTIRTMLNGEARWKEQNTGDIPTMNLEISTPILEKVIQYFYYKKEYEGFEGEIPKFDVGVDEVIDILFAAQFLDT